MLTADWSPIICSTVWLSSGTKNCICWLPVMNCLSESTGTNIGKVSVSVVISVLRTSSGKPGALITCGDVLSVNW